MQEYPQKNIAAHDDKISKGRINLERTSILLMDNEWGLEMLARIFVSFGARRLHRAQNIAQAGAVLAQQQVDLIVAEAMIGGEDIFQFIRAFRLDPANEPNRFVPVILLSAHTGSEKVAQARDSGINFFVAKPLSPKVIMDRVLWVAGGGRQYVETDTYAGPDRRVRAGAPPPGVPERRQAGAELPLVEKSA